MKQQSTHMGTPDKHIDSFPTTYSDSKKTACLCERSIKINLKGEHMAGPLEKSFTKFSIEVIKDGGHAESFLDFMAEKIGENRDANIHDITAEYVRKIVEERR